MLFDALVAESRKNDALDSVRSAALSRVRWLVDLLERQRTDYGRDAFSWRSHAEYERFQARCAAAQAEIDKRLAACPDADARAAVLVLMLAARFDDNGFWQYDVQISTLVPRVRGWTADEVAVMLLRATEYDMGFWCAGALGTVLDAAECLDADGHRAVAPWLRYAHAELMSTDVAAHLRGTLARRLRALLAGVDEAHIPEGLIPAYAPWAAALRDRAHTSPTQELGGFVRHLASLTGPRPAQRWRRTCLELTDAAAARGLMAEVLRMLAEGDPPCKVSPPFEDDRLSLILSKAFLLAADTKVTDETILRQIKRGA